jgi:3D (Asp-Asp-Asp) domain-containing protein
VVTLVETAARYAGGAFLILAAILAQGAQAEDKFDLPQLPSLNEASRLSLWSTYYYILSAPAVDVSKGHKLLGKQGKDHGVALVARDWCNAAVEGTVSVELVAPPVRTFNYEGLSARTQVDCLRFFPSLGPSIGKSLFFDVPADAPFGLGDTSAFRLVPFRSIAVDRSTQVFRQKADGKLRKVVIYVPGLRGVKITTPDGVAREHDGYLFAADTGGAIKGNHIDFFLGISTVNPAPRLIRSSATATFAAYVVEDPDVQEALYALHLRP